MKRLLALLVVLGVLSAASGTAVMQWPDSAFFRFSDPEPVSQAEALAAAADPQAYYDVSLEPWDRPAWCTNFIDAGEAGLSSLAVPPLSGYNDDVKGYMDCTGVAAGHAYWIKTRDGKYAKVKVTEARYLGVDPTNGNVNKVVFNWEYPAGSEAPGGCCAPAALILVLFGMLHARASRPARGQSHSQVVSGQFRRLV
jgi:hypothetical protein